jgi:hypothetical protein
MRIIVVLVTIVALIAPAYAQSQNMPNPGKPSNRSPATAPVDPEKKKKEDKAFNDAVKRIPEPEKKFDPWGVVRNGNAR